MNKELAVAVESFGETLQELGLKSRRRGLRNPRDLGRRAALMAASDLVWRNHLGRLLTRDETQELLGLKSRQAVSDLVKRGRLLALPARRGTKEFPAFQFDVEQGRVYAAVPRALEVLRHAFVDPFTAASWFVTDQDLLGTTPAEWLHGRLDDETLVEAAARAAAPLAR